MKTGNTDSKNFCGEIFINMFLNSTWKTERMKTIKNNPNAQKDIQLSVEKYPNQSYKTQSQKTQDALIQQRFHEEALEIMGETTIRLDEETGLKVNKIRF